MKKRYKKKKKSSVQLTGVVDHVKKRFCFVTVDGMTEDIKVRAQNMNGAIHEDSVELHLINNFSDAILFVVMVISNFQSLAIDKISL